MADVGPDIIFDDIGSYPLPAGMRRESLPEGEAYLELVKDAMAQKIEAGVERPTYPQFRDMIGMFMDPIEDPERSESPYVVLQEEARILELSALEALGRMMEGEGKRLSIRVCVTGPVELYISRFAATDYADILEKIAVSVGRFIEAAKKSRHFQVAVVSIDEPSLGISPSVIFGDDEIRDALEIAARPCGRIDCEIHLHSPLMAELTCAVPGINVIGVESAANPDYLKLIDRRVLEENDAFIRAGIARTDIDGLVARLNDRLDTNLWRDPERLEREVFAAESVEVLEERLTGAFRLFGDRLRYAGPDCGLGSWPSQKMALRCLASCGKAIASFRSRRDR
ncbi:methionine synthase [Methanotrichaceae archaeon M04Ac]|jgi:5-methyltetrahydropteroyltriglutamate--homocysteine methyltransferase|uniref:Methionine synthase n=1 Tax=Candidatus Methanocrinis alkalitolerans TaxID=3033395 RepID=A0ABT5XHR4_9EURY|nr:methionine synthase [Candidatus Methanocrinis alkalitolerans]MCR3884842.1 methionine synthase [Methanothrix sp.]MDF0594249.1 methionine synthase [Candidatus Methanocrinis alkalitolerans]